LVAPYSIGNIPLFRAGVNNKGSAVVAMGRGKSAMGLWFIIDDEMSTFYVGLH